MQRGVDLLERSNECIVICVFSKSVSLRSKLAAQYLRATLSEAAQQHHVSHDAFANDSLELMSLYEGFLIQSASGSRRKASSVL